jgi:YYY domain-containing protein
MGDAIVWWIALQLLGLAALPIGAVLFRALPDRGYAMSKPLGMLLVGWLAYMLAMGRILHFDRLSLIVCLLAVAGLSLFLLLRNGRALLNDLRAHFSNHQAQIYVVVCEVIFLVAYVTWAWVRAHNPDIVDQEKFMDFGFLNAILKSDTFPPNDMWLAGYSINYYYFGYILVAGLTALSGVATEVAFNLANVTLFSLTALGSFGVVHNLITARLLAAGRTHRREPLVQQEYRPARAERPLRDRRYYEPEQEPAPRRRQTVAASRPSSSRRGSVSTPAPASALPGRRPRPRPEPQEVQTEERIEEQIELVNEIDTTAEVLHEKSGGRRRGRRAEVPAEVPTVEVEGSEVPAPVEGEGPIEIEELVEAAEGGEVVEVEEPVTAVEEEELTPGEAAQPDESPLEEVIADEPQVDDGEEVAPDEEPAPAPARRRFGGIGRAPAQDIAPPRAPRLQPNLKSAIRNPQSEDPPYLPAGPGGAEPRRVPAYLSPYIFAILAALMVVAMGNLTVAFGVKGSNQVPPGQPFVAGNGFNFCFLCNGSGFNWFAPSRIISDFITQPDGSKQVVGFETINEFPAFSFVLADLHPHVLALPLVLLALSVGMAFGRRRVIRAEEWRDGVPPGLEAWLSLGIAGLIAGALYTTNTWDFPTYTLVMLLCLLFPYLAVGRRLGLGARWLRPYLVQAVLMGIFTIVTFLPFHLTFKSLVGGDAVAIPENIANIPIVGWIVGKLAELVLVNTADKTIFGFIVIFGVFLLSISVWLLFELASYMRRRYVAGDDINRSLIAWGAFVLLTWLAAFLLKFPLLALLLPIIVISFGLVWLEPRRTERNIALVLVGVGALIGLAVEIVFLRDNFQMRMNTLFKFYFQIWILWALPAAYAMWRVLYAALGDRAEEAEARRMGYYTQTSAGRVAGTVGSSILAVFFAFLVLTGSLYLYYAAAARQGVGSGPVRGLDGSTYWQSISAGDYDVMKWLKAEGRGNQIVMEGSAAEYDYAGRMSSFSGVPTLIGWDVSHENLWRTNQPDATAQIGERRRVVNSIYQGQDPNGGTLTAARLLELLNQYGVDYVTVGSVERGLRERAENRRPSEDVTPYAESLFSYALAEQMRSGDTVLYRVGDTVAGNGQIPATPSPNETPGATPQPTQPIADPNVQPAGLFANAGSGANRGQFNLPRGIARDAEGNFYVADTQNLRIQKFDPQGNWLLMFGSRGTENGQFSQLNETGEGTGPGGLAVDAAGNVYVADTWNHRIQKFDKDGNFLLAWGGFVSLADPVSAGDAARDSKFYGPRGVAVGPDGNVYVTDTGNKRVLIFDPKGTFVRKIDSGLTPEKITQGYAFDQPGEMNEPIGIAVDKDGNVYVGDTRNFRIQKFGSDGAPLAQWPVVSPNWDPGPYLEPFLGVDAARNVYATAPSGKTVLKLDPTGQVAGQKSSANGLTLRLPTGIWVDPDGTVYVVDTEGHAVLNMGSVP